MADESLIISIGANVDKFKEGIEEIKTSSEGLEDKLGAVAKIAGAVFASLQAGGALAVHEFAESQKATKELTLTLQNQGIASDELLKKYQDLSEELQHKTGIDNDQIKSGLGVLQGFLGQKEISEELAGALLDLSEKTGSVSSAAEILGRGINGNVRGLKQFGIEVSDSLSKEERLAAITDQVTQKFGGLAEENNKGLGAARGLKAEFNDFLKLIGEQLAPAVEKNIEIATRFFKVLQDPAIIALIVNVGQVVAILAGAALAITTASLAVVKLQQAFGIAKLAIEVFGISTRVAVGATGIGLLLIIAAEIYLNWKTIWPAMVAIFNAFANNIVEVGGGVAKVIKGFFSFDPTEAKAGIAQITDALKKGAGEIKAAVIDSKSEGSPGLVQDPEKEKAAQAAADRAAQRERDKLALLKAQNELVELEVGRSSAAVIDLQKQEIEILGKIDDEKYKGQRDALLAHLEEVRALQDEAVIQEEEQKKSLNEGVLAQNDAFNKLTAEQKQLFLAQNQAALQASIDTERNIKQKVAEESIKQEIATNNRFLIEKEKYGVAYATINKAIQSETVQGVKTGAGELVALTQSNNATLKAIGKAAAITDIVIKTASSAMNIYQAFSTIPFVGPALGIAGAAAAVAFGAENIGKVLSAADGGIATGGTPGQDSIPSMLMPGELVVPTKNFSEVVNAVATQRAQDTPQATSGVSGGASSGGGSVNVNLQFSGDNAEKFLTARQVESKSLGTLRSAS